jgi:hypothetical protein
VVKGMWKKLKIVKAITKVWAAYKASSRKIYLTRDRCGNSLGGRGE